MKKGIIVLIDDNPVEIDFFTDTLNEKRFVVRSFLNGKNGMEFILNTDSHIGLIIISTPLLESDKKTPQKMDTKSVIQGIREVNSKVPILLTGRREENSGVSFYFKANGYYNKDDGLKPFHPQVRALFEPPLPNLTPFQAA